MKNARKISFSEVLRKSAALSIDNIGLFVRVALVACLFGAILLLIPVFFVGIGGIKGLLSHSMGDAAGALRPLLPSARTILFGLLYGLLVWIIVTICWTGLIRIAFDLVDKGTSTVRHMYVGDRKLLSCISASCILLPAILLGFLCLIIPGVYIILIPGVYIILSCMFYSAVIIDRNVTPIQSIKESFYLTKGYRMQLFWWLLICIILNKVVGVIALPLALIGNIVIYRQLQELKAMH